MAGGNARIIRYVLLAFFIVTILWFLSSSSIPESTVPGGKSFEKWKAGKNKNKADTTTGTLSALPGTKDAIEKALAPGQPSVQAPGQAPAPPGIEVGPAPSPAPEVGVPVSNTSPDTAQNSITPNAPPEPQLPATGKMNATFVTLARNSDLWDIVDSIRGIEDRFNRNYGYDWVFLNDKPFDEDFKKITTALISGKTHFGMIPEEHWSFPDWIDQGKAQKVREDMAERKIIYGDSVSYRHMCRFESGFFFRQPLMQNYEWYWRVEPSVKIFCDIKFDPFRFMVENKKKYAFVISLYEYVETIPTIWDSAKRFMSEFPQHIAPNNAMKWLSDDDGESYNHCHFWSNFEVGNLNWLRSPAYTDFFDVLDKDGGFFYERWGDAPVHSIAAGLLLNRDEIHFFEDIGYWHVPFTHCPTEEAKRLENKCHCNPHDNFDWKGYSCTTKWFDLNKLPKPPGWKDQAD